MVRAHATRVVYQGQVGYESGSAEKWQQVPNAGHKKRRGGGGQGKGRGGGGCVRGSRGNRVAREGVGRAQPWGRVAAAVPVSGSGGMRAQPAGRSSIARAVWRAVLPGQIRERREGRERAQGVEWMGDVLSEHLHGGAL